MLPSNPWHRLADRKLEDRNVLSERLRLEVAEFRKPILEITRKIYFPSGLDDPDRLTWPHRMQAQQFIPPVQEILSGEYI